jgi:hypothetical protein
MDREINLVEFLFTFNTSFSAIESTCSTHEEIVITITQPKRVLAYQGWDISTPDQNSNKRVTHQMSLSEYFTSIEIYNEKYPKNKYTPSLVLRLNDNLESFIMTVTNFQLMPDNNCNHVYRLTVKNNYLDSFSNMLLSINNIIGTEKQASFMFTGFNYEDLNFNNHLNHGKGPFTRFEEKIALKFFSQGVIMKNYLRLLPTKSVNFLYDSTFDVTLADNGNFILTHHVHEQTPHILAFQGWDKYTSSENNKEARSLQNLPLDSFCDFIKINRQEVIENQLILINDENTENQEIALGRFSFQPTCLFLLENDETPYLGVIKNFRYKTTTDPNNISNISNEFIIEISTNDIKKNQKIDMIGNNKKIFLNIDGADTTSCSCNHKYLQL